MTQTCKVLDCVECGAVDSVMCGACAVQCYVCKALQVEVGASPLSPSDLLR